MAIQVRRGLKKDFDPYKMLPGEWAVSIDAQTKNQMVWMCFAAGVVKRMGTYEDFYAQIEEITNDILEKFITILTDAAKELQDNVESYIQGKVDDEWIPTLEEYVRQAEESARASADSASESAASAKESADSAAAAKESEYNAKESENNAKESEKNAALSEKNADDWSKFSESHNHGGTGFRSGEDTDNSKYWSERSRLEAERAKIEADKAEQYAGITAPDFYLDLDDMVLYIKDGVGVDFVLDEDNVLYWAVA